MGKTMRIRLVMGLIIMDLLTGCAHKDTIVGKWQGTTTTPQGAVANTTFEFTEDGKENLMLQASQGPLSINLTGSGTYSVSGNTLTQTITSMTMGSMNIPVPADRVRPEADPFTLDGDTLTITNPTSKKSLTLTRVKQ